MQEIVQEVLAYLLENPVVYAGLRWCRLCGKQNRRLRRTLRFLSLFGRRRDWFILRPVRVIFFRLHDYLENLPQFRFLFDFVVAYVGSFITAAIIHFVKPM
jgi:hypothetical protein